MGRPQRRTGAIEVTWRRKAAGIVIGTLAALSSVMLSPAAVAAQDAWCGPDLGGRWDAQNGLCTLSLVSRANATVDISLAVPLGLIDDRTAGPVIRDYVSGVGNRWRANAHTMMRDNTSSLEFDLLAHSNAVQTVVFHERFQTVGALSNDSFHTFTFDLQQGRPLRLVDLFSAGVDPLTAIPPLAEPFLNDALAQAQPPHQPDVYPFTTDRWRPQPDGSGFSGNYRAFALTPDELILYMPDSPMLRENPIPRGEWVWSMNGGVVIVHVPLAVLRPILAPAYMPR